MSRYADTSPPSYATDAPPLPPVDYRRVGCAAPRTVEVPDAGPQAHLPEADVAVLTWTSAEWSALDQVFLGHRYPRPAHGRDWQRAWHLFSAGAPAPDPTQNTGPLWGLYQLVDVPGPGGSSLRALLFKADTHLAHPPWYAGLTTMVEQILKESRVGAVYSVGTAGGGHPDQKLGEVVVTDAAHVQLKNPNNDGAGISGQTFTCGGQFPATVLLDEASAQLMTPLSSVVTWTHLERLLDDLKAKTPAAATATLEELVTPALDPANLHRPAATPLPGQPLLTTDYYYIADGDSEWSVLEMDDAVIAHVAGRLGVDYAFFRNVSDPVVPAAAADGTPLDAAVRGAWSSMIYTDFGLFTSYNGAVATWAALAARAG
jgi:nucleoside phosphorylase